jgi:hypothetical protein
MEKERASLGFGDEFDSFDPAQWSPKPSSRANDTVKPEDARKAADAAGFKSREPVKAPAAPQTPVESPRVQRRRRTGRNVQFNIKARQETIDAFCEVADGQGWGLGETLEHAVELLKAKYGGAGGV